VRRAPIRGHAKYGSHMKTIVHDGHKIETRAWGTEKVSYDGRQVSSKNSIMGATHVASRESVRVCSTR
jgi:hypothetical protein